MELSTRRKTVSVIVHQTIALSKAGSELILITVNTEEAAAAVPKIAGT